jgi:hypothetical protein
VNKFLGALFVLLGIFLVFKAVLGGAFLFLLLAAGLAVGAATRAIGRWAYALAGLFVLLALPGLLFRSVFFGVAMLVKLAPVLLVLYGVYLLLKAFK